MKNILCSSDFTHPVILKSSPIVENMYICIACLYVYMYYMYICMYICKYICMYICIVENMYICI